MQLQAAFQADIQETDTVLTQFPDTLRLEVSRALNWKTICMPKWMRKAKSPMLDALVLVVHAEIFIPGYVVINNGDLCTRMHWVQVRV